MIELGFCAPIPLQRKDMMNSTKHILVAAFVLGASALLFSIECANAKEGLSVTGEDGSKVTIGADGKVVVDGKDGEKVVVDGTAAKVVVDGKDGEKVVVDGKGATVTTDDGKGNKTVVDGKTGAVTATGVKM